jgi:hypothetical protein
VLGDVVHHSSLGRVAANRRPNTSTGVSTPIRLGVRRPGRDRPYRPWSDMIERPACGSHSCRSRQRGADSSAPVGAARTLVDLGDRVSHNEPPHLTAGDTAPPVYCHNERVNPVIRQAERAECPRAISPSAITRRGFGGTTAAASNSSHASRVNANYSLQRTMRWRAAANSSASTLGTSGTAG